MLLRGINLGAARRVPMVRLRETLTRAGYEDVRTLLQSGNRPDQHLSAGIART